MCSVQKSRGQRSKVKVTRGKKRKTADSSPVTMHSKACTASRRALHAAADDTIASQPGDDRMTAVHADGGLRERSSRGTVLGGLVSASSTPVGKSAHAV